MLFLSPEAIDITAALARSAMSRTERPEDCGACGGGPFSATCCGAGAGFALASAVLGASTGFASASFVATAFGASASFGASGAGAAFAAFDTTLCGDDA